MANLETMTNYPFVSFSQSGFYILLKHSSTRTSPSLPLTQFSILFVAMGWSLGTMSVVTNSSKCAIYGLEAHPKAATITTNPKLERGERSSKNSLQNKAFGEFLPKSPTPKASVSPELPRINLPATPPCSPARLLFQPPSLSPAHLRAPLQNRQLVGLCGHSLE